MRVSFRGACIFVAVVVVVEASCQSALNCSLNGECKAGVCSCRPAWTGDACGVLKLKPVPADTLGATYKLDDTSSWGGSVMKGPDGLYHMYVSEFLNHCGLNAWNDNSLIVHATSKTPEGPYQRVDVAIPHFSHNPVIVQAPNGSYVLYHIGCGLGLKTRECKQGCEGGAGPPKGTNCSIGVFDSLSAPQCQGYADPPNFFFSSSLEGPWTVHPMDVKKTKMFQHMDNPAPIIFADGSVSMLVRHFPEHGEGSRLGMATAKHWLGTYQMPTESIGHMKFPSMEDPFLYRDANGAFHALFHRYKPADHVGAHAFSPDGHTWYFSEAGTYAKTVQVEGGTTFEFARRERPHCLLDGGVTGDPTHLFTGVLPHASSDRTWTHVHIVESE